MKISSVLSVFAGVFSCAADTPTIFGLSTCASRCYWQTAELLHCSAADFSCSCTAWDTQFYPQYSSCLVEGCLGTNPALTASELQEKICAAAENTSSLLLMPTQQPRSPAVAQQSNTETVGTLTQPASILSTSVVGITANATSTSTTATATQTASNSSDEESGVDDTPGSMFDFFAKIVVCTCLFLMQVDMNWFTFRIIEFN